MKGVTSKKLKGLMAEHNLSVIELSKKMKIPARSLSSKINGRQDWLYSELLFIMKEFGFFEVKNVFPELYIKVLKAG